MALNNELFPDPVGPNIITNSPLLISIEISFNKIISLSLFICFSFTFFSKVFISNLISSFINFSLLSEKISFNSYSPFISLFFLLILFLISLFFSSSILLSLIPKVALSNLINKLFLFNSSLFLYLFSLCSSPFKKFWILSIDKIFEKIMFKKAGIACMGKVIERTN